MINKKELGAFLISGCLAVGTDFLVYFFLQTVYLWPASVAKALSFLAGTLVAYGLNKYWTFKQPGRSVREAGKFCLLYAITLGINVSVNKGVLAFFPQALLWGFLWATGTSTGLNFIGQKWWVFRKDLR